MTPEQAALVYSSAAAFVGAVAAVVSAVAAVIAVREQRKARTPSVEVRVSTFALTHGRPGLPGASVEDEPWLAIIILNRGIVPVTVLSAGIVTDHGTAPFFGSTSGVGDELPKRLDAGERAQILFDELRTVANTHVTPGQGPVRHAEVTLAGGQEVRSKPIDGRWLNGWATEEAKATARRLRGQL